MGSTRTRPRTALLRGLIALALAAVTVAVATPRQVAFAAFPGPCIDVVDHDNSNVTAELCGWAQTAGAGSASEDIDFGCTAVVLTGGPVQETGVGCSLRDASETTHYLTSDVYLPGDASAAQDDQFSIPVLTYHLCIAFYYIDSRGGFHSNPCVDVAPI